MNTVTRCLLFSIALHAAVFAWWPRETPLAVPPPAAPLAWVLLAAETKAPAAQAVETVTAAAAAAAPPVPLAAAPFPPNTSSSAADVARDDEPTAASSAAATMAATSASAATADIDEPPETASSAQPAAQGGTPDTDAGPAMLAVRLRDALAARFVYPALARREGWQGEVKVGVRVNADGRLSDIHLVASSGHAVLDRAALRSLAEVRRLDDGGRWLSGSHFDMVLPIQYHLIDG